MRSSDAIQTGADGRGRAEPSRDHGVNEQVEAAGGVVVRRRDDDVPETLVVHRPKHGDWSLPKGKLHAGEGHVEAALREVEEETGYRCLRGRELSQVRYRDGGDRPKRVRYWVMHPVAGEGRFEPFDEVDAIRWLPFDEARCQLTYDRDRDLLDEVTDLDIDHVELQAERR